jgi:hypothetical protein
MATKSIRFVKNGVISKYLVPGVDFIISNALVTSLVMICCAVGASTMLYKLTKPHRFLCVKLVKDIDLRNIRKNTKL